MVDKNYRMSKPTKCMLDMMQDRELRTTYKKMFMEAESQYTSNRKKMIVKFVDSEGEE